MPREIRAGLADMVVQAVEAEPPEAEVAEAVAALVRAAPACAPWPALWIEGGERRSYFLVRYDLMTRDWGEEVAAEARARMEEFVAMGALTSRARPEIGADVVEYVLTEYGREMLHGSPYTSQRPAFCGPSERRLVEITRMERGRFPCGSLRVHFRHVADVWPSWAQGEHPRTPLAWPPLGMDSEGLVTLSRQWFAARALPPRASNGALRSVCFEDGRVIGGDLQLFPAQ